MLAWMPRVTRGMTELKSDSSKYYAWTSGLFRNGPTGPDQARLFGAKTARNGPFWAHLVISLWHCKKTGLGGLRLSRFPWQKDRARGQSRPCDLLNGV
jgi:hypothetical protein